ncbi:hypothetical protein [Conexibacter woesei]|uniref:ABC-2 type transport system permease protein n=1 Tax=Conexibacter woesei (strain DSM 14684 / CCUG 47730 / CIP 108061 / JCM 11494 / NBRC 100937 / ID131577) TaxID=469383 RepID=D3FBW1_CONWI|nr:hypothetical protein [Conexibacter woesei]ADB51376.1 hypothetical protein Cwoe_2957 [Conexibacter woesei DSM 14684]
MNLLLVELEKLRTVRTTWLLLVVAVLGPLPIAIAILTQTDRLDRAPQEVLGLIVLTALLAAALGASACAREFELRTITTAFTLEPRRERIVAAKAAAAAIVGAAAALLCVAFLLSLTAIWLSSSDAPWPWTSGETLSAIAGAVIVTVTLAVAGTGFGGVTRHVGSAITLFVLVYFVLEGVLVARLGFWSDYGITAAGSTLTEPGVEHALSYVGALAVVVGLSLAVLAGGIAVVRRSDV